MLRFLHGSSDNVTAGDISEFMHVSTARVAVLMKKMSAQGLITKEGDARDARITIVRITPKGEEKVQQIHDAIYAQVNDIIDRVGMKKIMDAYNYYENMDSMIIHRPDPTLSTAENFLMMLRPDRKYTPIEAKVLDTALILHMEHGGGNNSTFTTRVITSSGSDTYSTMAAAMSSLKGPKHGGANIKVMEMMGDIRNHVSDYSDKDEVGAYLTKIINKEAFDKKGLVYGMGHAVYSLSDPRERVFKGYVEKLAAEKGREMDLELYQNVEELAPKLIAQYRHIYKGVSPNVDFYSGFVYDMLGIPQELYTAMFAIARIVGWSAHRIEELICTDKIIRPAYMSVMEEK